MQDSQQHLSASRERVVLWLLASLQFTHLLDFMILTPLAPQFMREWGITASQFGTLVSVYALAAAVAGLLASFVIDRFDRKKVLALVYAVFVVATLACALAPGFWSLLGARALAGASGGVVGSLVMAIVGDLIYLPPETPLLAAARARGNITVNGLGLLLNQARPAFKAWFGVMPEITPALHQAIAATI